MPTRNIRRGASIIGSVNPAIAPIYVDSDTNTLKLIPAGSGTTEVELADLTTAQTFTNKTLTSPVINGYSSLAAVSLTPTATDSAGVNIILPGVTVVRLAANVTDANDYTVLPALANVPNGHRILIIAGAVGSEVRTPASSAEEINSEDCDGTKEYILAATQLHYFVKIDNTIGWMGHGFTAIGAVAAAIVPD